ncbi:MAG: hypothetical protein A3J62_01105 [Candidatus Buchananbacteria bacterium RIFCSPHIGHO2_02_FULL_38_8]|uniref:UPF0102 protein A2731_02300 n=2 Tax=Candidatus Buchananiibacteriota TaxID=1817903 RepID=A0A1G1XWV1_9BACT|nr:MAG: hypothetical protein A2731_02300 [Candidatus Buchananbacteria bacterium RIFCSPHIGHO2_01_FULL_39_8]OGY47790.1 MAG: hypothetical protein A3J62_01105 [Candidatus Buchananbacteria bacterium RIFCSPHIGHO2_02_FULL_38_8]
MSNNKKIGKSGERIAKWYFKNRGYQILETNYHTRQGEIDIICKKDMELVFVEVKTRTSTSFGYPEQAINEQKQKHLAEAIEKFVSEYQGQIELIRIDAICIQLNSHGKASIKHFENIIQDTNHNDFEN